MKEKREEMRASRMIGEWGADHMQKENCSAPNFAKSEGVLTFLLSGQVSTLPGSTHSWQFFKEKSLLLGNWFFTSAFLVAGSGCDSSTHPHDLQILCFPLVDLSIVLIVLKVLWHNFSHGSAQKHRHVVTFTCWQKQASEAQM